MRVEMLENFPTMEVYHCTLSLRARDSVIMRDTKATSPPRVTISDSEPVQAVNGGRCLVVAEVSMSALEE